MYSTQLHTAPGNEPKKQVCNTIIHHQKERWSQSVFLVIFDFSILFKNLLVAIILSYFTQFYSIIDILNEMFSSSCAVEHIAASSRIGLVH